MHVCVCACVHLCAKCCHTTQQIPPNRERIDKWKESERKTLEACWVLVERRTNADIDDIGGPSLFSKAATSRRRSIGGSRRPSMKGGCFCSMHVRLASPFESSTF